MTAAEIELAAGQVWRATGRPDLRIGRRVLLLWRRVTLEHPVLASRSCVFSNRSIRGSIRRFGMELAREPNANPWNDLGVHRDPMSGGDWTPEKEARA